MMRVVGIDPGSHSFDIFCIESFSNTRKIVREVSISIKTIKSTPEIILSELEKLMPFDMCIAPSGFGLPIKKIQDITDDDISEMVLRLKTNTDEPELGLTKLLNLMRSSKYPLFTIPGVKQLFTVPTFRKINKIDMGTSDKVSSIVLALDFLQTHLDVPSNQINTILLELGGSFSAVIAVKNGQIIDGVGGTQMMGWRNGGVVDGEIISRLQSTSKNSIYKGGVIGIIQKILNSNPKKYSTEEYYGFTHDEFLEYFKQFNFFKNVPEIFKDPLMAWFDQINKTTYSLLSLYEEKPLNIISLSGRLVNIPFIYAKLEKMLVKIAPLVLIPHLSNNTKRAAQGAALIAEGLLGGKSANIIKNLHLDQKDDSLGDNNLLSHIYFDLKED